MGWSQKRLKRTWNNNQEHISKKDLNINDANQLLKEARFLFLKSINEMKSDEKKAKKRKAQKKSRKANRKSK
jgi:hypothetical protein